MTPFLIKNSVDDFYSPTLFIIEPNEGTKYLLFFWYIFFAPSYFLLGGICMDKDTNITNYNHSINIVERKNILVTGVKKIESFDNEEFLMETVMGFLVLKGDDLELLKLDTLQGNVSIKGFLKSFAYVDDATKKEKESSIISRLFK